MKSIIFRIMTDSCKILSDIGFMNSITHTMVIDNEKLFSSMERIFYEAIVIFIQYRLQKTLYCR